VARARAAPAIALAVIGVLAACGSGNPVIEGTPPPALPNAIIAGVEVTIHGTTTASGGSVELETADDFYSPTIIRGPAGAAVRIAVRNYGLHPHNVSGLGPSTDIPPGEERTIVARFPSLGVKAFYCRFHRTSAAMLGELFAAGPTS
jgi:hypothetical protein